MTSALNVIYRYLVIWHIAKHGAADTDAVPVSQGMADDFSVTVIKSVRTHQGILGILPQLHGTKSNIRFKSHCNGKLVIIQKDKNIPG